MDQTLLSAIVALKDEITVSLTALGDFPKKDPYDHGMQVGTYYGLRRALEILEGTLNDETVRLDNL